MATQRLEIAALRLSAEQVIDTTAAGDSFSAAYLAARLQGADAAAEAIRQMRAAYPDLLIGAGTVLNREQVDAAVAAGADFIVSPGFNPTTVQYCLDKDVTIIPGVNNPSLVEQAMEMGLRHLKFFPAEQSGGTAMLKALGAVYPVRFMPTGGVTPANLKEYLGLNAVIACGGTWMVPAKLIDEGRWEELAALVREAVAAL
ncbi:bifunctional 4-hydroxy-2-oxoglutarate aldolase/2-dehydro-3-deoxy-phosphogluconate aldolase [Aeromonas caviae]|uniref:Bifunctional 4-hydroxy-2-oxoglutarate aldolase/2-dehydro-3-deoxy-phosphogluconate aldolase n=1 Tax=Aeromonas caviae TaxID=648 RepID=A0AAW9ET13_AERCA|nr:MULTISPECIES: bifunctional 4-hydroxy-2-oxoglutarate aldolase/2-dehydro-3-deoxy-phosphogluconate aldolase [Aeromonas]MBP4033270.1 bifunctional 4-hydroxy-2-oxoglutarate aldolase/2-dehydro-3-deoxy-phosphogluconate aldolase [Aeromonas sp. PrichA-15]MDX7719710.1 bifunctional 4-hydroxy-2-oxoglutarate aldolase/2-dehydro-3-deoxy-phosphogluconate aldolase [Aeromonas caviae]